MSYWRGCVIEALDAAGIKATNEQITEITSWVEGAHENYGMAHGRDSMPSQTAEENQKLSKALEAEREKITCPTCDGSGTDTDYNERMRRNPGNLRGCCRKCDGEGKVQRP